MTTRPKRNSLIGWPSGLTLIEVVVGAAIAGTLLVSAILGASSHRRQLRLAQQKMEAVESIDRLLSAWAVYGFASESLPKAASACAIRLRQSAIASEASDGIELATFRTSAQTTHELGIDIVRVEAYLPNVSKPISWIEVACSSEETPE